MTTRQKSYPTLEKLTVSTVKLIFYNFLMCFNYGFMKKYEYTVYDKIKHLRLFQYTGNLSLKLARHVVR